MPKAGERWWARFGPIVLSKAKRRYWGFVTFAWLALGIIMALAGRFGLLWFPAIGLVGSFSVLLRDRAGRRRMFGDGSAGSEEAGQD